MRKKKDDNDTSIKKVSNYSKKKYNATHSQKPKLDISILQKNDEKLEYFKNKDKIIKQCQKQIDSIQKEIDNLNNEISINEANNNKIKNINIKYDIKNLNNKIKNIEKNISDTSTDKLLNDYIINTFMLVNEYYILEEEQDLLNSSGAKININFDKDQRMFEINKKKMEITDDYMKYIEPGYISKMSLLTTDTTICSNCKSKLEMANGCATCYDCGYCYSAIHQPTELGYKESQEIDHRAQFTYDKRTHLQEWLRRFQAKENKDIPQDILDKVILEAKKQRITDLNMLNEKDVKMYLKKLNLNNYYDNVITIINRINKRQPFTLTVEIEDKIMRMFQQIQEPFSKFKDVSRKNMLSYSYLINKFFLILGLPEFSKYFFLLKSPEKLRQQDQTFKKIVDYMADVDPKTPWMFYPSL